ncbi:MAG: DUF1501 domain-containing protein [Saprospiraceae bacterium]|nr:DUF1501 domain-containing protein [Saprospiraceae bacterium]
MQRRKFIKHATRTALLPSMLNGMGIPAFARSPLVQALSASAEETDRVLVLIYLGGGNDGLNTLVPVDQYDILSRARPDVLLPENSLLSLTGVSDLKLHPALSGFRSLYDNGTLAVIQNVGYPNQNYSHFRSTDIWMTAADSSDVLSTGWLGRFLNEEYPNYPVDYPNSQVPDPLAIEIGYNLSIAFQGPVTGMGMVVADPDWFYQLVNDVNEPTPDTKAGEKLDYVRLITKQSQVYGEVIKNAASKVTNQLDYPANDLANQLKIVSRLIAGGLQTRLYMVSLQGFDTHDSQVLASDHTKGEHANLLEYLGNSVAAFMKDLEYLNIADRVMGATVSEFGRRIISNASLGTDHGAAAPMFIFGNAVSGGIYGNNPVLPSNPEVDDNLEMKVDFRSVYGSILQNWFCVNSNVMAATLPGNQEIIPFVNESACLSTSIFDRHQLAGRKLIDNYPNPFQGSTIIRFESLGNPLQIQILDQQGRILEVLTQGSVPQGTHEIAWDATRYPSGIYYARFQDADYQQSCSLLKN